MMVKCRLWMTMLVVMFLVSALFAGYVQAFEIGDFTLNGYLRQYVSVNLDDVPQTSADDKGKISMSRQSLLLQLRGEIGPTNLTVIGRLDNEQMTSYQEDLERSTRLVPGGRGDFEDQYNKADIREFFLDIPIGERVNMRLGKQQVVWGETDFFQAMDVVHGYDQTWRSFLEPENEEWRKPLILANVNIDVPELEGTLQLLVRPGLDSDKDIGNTYDMFGGRWTQDRVKGFDLNGSAVPVHYDHSKGDADDAHYGARWSGTLWDQDYSLNYYHTQAQNPVVALAEKPSPGGVAFIHPEIDIYGGTLSGYIPAIDSVYRLEAAYIPDNPFDSNTALLLEKDTVRVMLGCDTSMRLQDLIGTSGPGMVSLQIFDTWILDYEASEQITNAFGTTEDEHTTWTTMILTFPYRNDTIVGQLVAVNDISNGGGVVVPSVEFQFGPHWRLKTELDLFYGGQTFEDTGYSGATLFGSFDNNNQWFTKLTYQF